MSAEFGRTAGGIISVVSRGGSNEFHGIAGIVGGLLLSLMLSGNLSKWAEGSAHHPLTFAAVTLLLAATSALAALIPARRASSIDPMDALRYE